MAIVGTPNSQDDVMEKLKTLPFDFYPTGSRFFGTARVVSDYDFYAQDTKRLEDTLHELGFECYYGADEAYYRDNQTMIVYRIDYEQTHIDIQLVRDVQVKTAAQVMIQKIPVLLDQLSRVNKYNRHLVWNQLYDFVKEYEIKSRPASEYMY